MGEDWAWFAITDGHCGAATLERAGPESTRLHGIDLRSEREHRWPLAVRSWLIAPGGRLITVNHATRESLRLTLLPLDNPTRPQELELAEFSPAEALNGWDFGPAYSSDPESGRVVLNLAVMRQGNRVVADPDADPIPDLLLIEVEGAALHLLGATDLSSGSGWHPTLMESPWEHRRLLLTAERMLLVGSGELIELLARDGRLTSGARLSY
jgi:hypothetical protein